MSSKSDGTPFYRWFIGTIIALLAAGGGLVAVLNYFSSPRPPTPDPPGRPKSSFVEQASGVYKLVAWEETHGPTTLYIDVKEGSLAIDSSGEATWELLIQQRGDRNPAGSRVRCKGRVTAAGQSLQHVDGPGNEAINWDRNIESVRDSVWVTFCGSTVGGSNDPFSLDIQPGSGGYTILTMRNSKGTFTWRK